MKWRALLWQAVLAALTVGSVVLAGIADAKI